MLVLSRERGESIMIGDNIIITIVDIRGDKVRLGVNAPSEISVHRQEVYEAIQRENLRASRLEPKDARAPGKPASPSQGGTVGKQGFDAIVEVDLSTQFPHSDSEKQEE